MKLEIIGMQRSWLKFSGETCSRRTWPFQEQGRRKGGSRTELSHAVLRCLAGLVGQDRSWRCGEGGCAAMPAAPPPSVGLEVCPSQVRRNEGFPLPPLDSRVGQRICLLLSRSLGTADNSLDRRLLWFAFFELVLTCRWLARVPQLLWFCTDWYCARGWLAELLRWRPCISFPRLKLPSKSTTARLRLQYSHEGLRAMQRGTWTTQKMSKSKQRGCTSGRLQRQEMAGAVRRTQHLVGSCLRGTHGGRPARLGMWAALR